jgi:hypothetical protein
VAKEDQDRQGLKDHVVSQDPPDREVQMAFQEIQVQEVPSVCKEVLDYLEFQVQKVYQARKARRENLA